MCGGLPRRRSVAYLQRDRPGRPPRTVPLPTDPAAPPAVRPEIRVEGIAVAPGVAVGPAYLYAAGAYQAEPEKLSPDAVEAELARFERAVARSERELGKISVVARQKLGAASAGIFDAQAMMLRDGQFYDAVADRVREQGSGAGWAVQSVLAEHRRRLEGSASA